MKAEPGPSIERKDFTGNLQSLLSEVDDLLGSVGFSSADQALRAKARNLKAKINHWRDLVSAQRELQRHKEHPIARANYDRWIIDLFRATESAVPREALLRDFVRRFSDVHLDFRKQENSGPWAIVLSRTEGDLGYGVEGFAQSGVNANAWGNFKRSLRTVNKDPTLRLIFEERERIEQWYLAFFIDSDYQGVFDSLLGKQAGEPGNVWMSAQPLINEAGKVEHAVVLLYKNAGKLFDLENLPAGSSQDLRALDVLSAVYRQLEYQIANLAAFVERARSEMLGQVSPGLLAHELLPGLKAIDGISSDVHQALVRFVTEYQAPKSIDTALLQIDSIKAHGRSVVRIAESIMQLERRGRSSSINLFELGERTRLLLHVRCGTAGVNFENNLDLGTTIHSDDSLLLLLLLNIVSNALDAFEEAKPPVAIRTMKLRMGISNEREVALEIANTGPPIPLHLIERIFDRGFSTRSAGHGQGLYLVKMIAQHCGGDVRVAPELCQTGEQVCFLVRLLRHLPSRENLGHVLLKR